MNPKEEKTEASKQFQPKKFKETGQNWLKEQSQASFTPFKSSTMSRSTTPQPGKDISPRSGTLRPPTKPNPFVFEAPQSHSTPKSTHGQQIRPGSAMTMNRDHKLTWGRLPVHPSARSSSAMGQSYTLRPPSRQNEPPMANMGNMGNGVGSRYQSYCTLPRPEQLDAESLSEMQGQQFYGPPKIVSRPPSAVPMMPGMASDFGRPPSAFMAPTVQNGTMNGQKPFSERDIVNWNTLSTFGSMQVLCGLCIFGLGVARMLQGAKWAFGVELAYALFVLVAALSSIYAVRSRNYSAAAFSYSLAAFNMILAVPPFVIGLFPTIPLTFPEANEAWFVNKNEPVELDILLSVVVMVQVILSLVVCVSGCRSVGVLCSNVNEIKLQNEMRRAFPGHSPIPHKA